MASIPLKKLNNGDSDEDFEFLDAEDDLDVNKSEPPISEAAENLDSGVGLMISTLIRVVEEKGWSVSVPVATVATTAIGAITGSLIGGGPGLAVGVITAAVLAYRNSPRRTKPPQPEPKKISIRQILSQLTLQQKKELLRELLGCLKHSNVRALIVEILKNEKIRNMALEILSGFLMKKVGISLVRSS